MPKNKDRKLSKPHNDFYQQALSHTQVAQEFFAINLPKHVLDIIDLDTLTPEKDTFSDHQAGVRAVDSLFSVKFGREEGYLLLLSEHQSTCDYFMAMRLMEYKILICKQHHLRNPKSKHIPLVYVMVYYTGQEKYTAPLDFFDLFANPGLARKLFTSPYQLVDLYRTPDEKIEKTVWLAVMMMVMKYAKSKDIVSRLLDMKPMLVKIGGKNYIYIEMIFRYIIDQADTEEINEVVDIFKNLVSEEDREKIMTIADRLIEQGIQKGIQLGKQEGIQLEKMHIASNMLAKGQSISFISEVTGLSEAEVKRIADSNSNKNNTH